MYQTVFSLLPDFLSLFQILMVKETTCKKDVAFYVKQVHNASLKNFEFLLLWFSIPNIVSAGLICPTYEYADGIIIL
jgi:hypothetical protein